MTENHKKPQLHSSWLKVLENEFQKEYFIKLKSFLLEEKSKHQIFPPGNEIFNAYNFTPLHDVKVVIIGQDPYHNIEQAHGLSFSVKQGIKPPPSLVNIYKELKSDLGITPATHGNLESWAKQGVLLLNATLTVRAHEAGSHQKKGWEQFTNTSIKAISDNNKGVVFLLWGRFAQQKEILIDKEKHFVLKAAHPSPFSAHNGFLGCKHFSKTNELILNQNKQPINWDLN